MSRTIKAYINPENPTEVIIKTERYIVTSFNDTVDEAKQTLEEAKRLDHDTFESGIQEKFFESKESPAAE